jgi:hypothetical protein
MSRRSEPELNGSNPERAKSSYPRSDSAGMTPSFRSFLTKADEVNNINARRRCGRLRRSQIPFVALRSYANNKKSAISRHAKHCQSVPVSDCLGRSWKGKDPQRERPSRRLLGYFNALHGLQRSRVEHKGALILH